MNAKTETTVLRSLTKGLNTQMEMEIEICERDEMFQSTELSKNQFQLKAYARYVEVLLNELKDVNAKIIFAAKKNN